MKKMSALVITLIIINLLLLTSCSEDNIQTIQLEIPTNIYSEGKIVYWEDVENADGYMVSVESEENETELPYYDFSTLYNPGDYEITIYAYSKNVNYIDSEIAHYTLTIEEPVECGYDEKGFAYTLLSDGSGYSISRGYADFSGDLVLPSYYCGLPVKEIREYAFSIYPGNPLTGSYMNFTTTSITLPEKLVKICGFSFMGFGKIKTIECPETLEVIGGGTFLNCPNLEKVTFNEGLKEIRSFAFQGCRIQKLELPSTLEKIGGFAFAASTEEISFSNQFKSVTFPDSLKEVGISAFKNCQNLSEINISYSNQLEDIENTFYIGTKWRENQKSEFIGISNILFEYTGDSESVEIPSKYTKIAGKLFYENQVIKDVYVPDGITFVGGDTFSATSCLKNLRLPKDLKEIPQNFLFLSGIPKINLPDSLEVIGEYAFGYCKNLTTFTLTKNISSIEQYAFFECNNLVEIINYSNLKLKLGSQTYGSIAEYAKLISETNNYKSNIINQDDYLFYNDNDNYYLLCYIGDNYNLVLPESINGHSYELNNGAFSHNNAIKTIVFPNCITKVRSREFEFCDNLEKVVLSDSIVEIGDHAFYLCMNLKDITLSKNLESIGDGAFSSCSSLQSIQLNRSLKKIGTNVFPINGDFKIYYNGTKEEFDSIEGVDNAFLKLNDKYIFYLYIGDDVYPLG